MGSRPLRFLVLAVGGWVCVRTAMLVPAYWPDPADPSPPQAHASIVEPPTLIRPLPPPPSVATDAARLIRLRPVTREDVTPPSDRLAPQPRATAFILAAKPSSSEPPLARVTDPLPSPPVLSLPAPGTGRWSASAWLFVRRGEGGPLATGGTLGGSQAGGRLSYRLGPGGAGPMALTARFYAPLDEPAGGEVSMGVEWKPLPALPVALLAERRQAVARAGRSAFSLLAYGGVSERQVLGPVRLDAYGQAGVVGLRSRDLFADGSVRLTAPVDRAARLKLGVGVWGAAQPGVARLDVGPHVSTRLRRGRAAASVAAEWRLRIAGDARPASGPALTLSADF